MVSGIVLYNLWIILTAGTGVSALVLAVYFLRLKEKLWFILALVFFALAIDCIDASISLGIGYNSACRVTSITIIAKRMLVRAFELGAVFWLKAYIYGYFYKRRRDSKDYPEVQSDERDQ